MNEDVGALRRELRAAEKRLHACVITTAGAAVLLISGLMLALTSVLLQVQ